MAEYPELKGRLVLVTGGAQGIGAATVKLLEEQGARVAFCDLDAGAGRSLAQACGADVQFTRLDLRRPEAIRKWIGRAAKWGGGLIHAVVNNAACDPRMSLESMKVTDWDRLFEVNLRAFFLVSQAAVPLMSAGSAMVNLASITIHEGPANMSAYVATKGGILGFTRSLARELGPRRIRVNTVSPGWIMTERQLQEYVTPAVKRMLRKAQSIPDLMQPREVAEVVAFLISDGARGVTGQEILVDRGWHYS